MNLSMSFRFQLVLCLGFGFCAFTSGGLVNGGHYRIRSMYDGLYASAGMAFFNDHMGGRLGNITTEKWGNFREQRWDLIGLDQIEKEFWIFSQENTFNKMSAVIVNEKPDRHITELIPVSPTKYLICSTVNKLCFDNPGYGVTVLLSTCDELSPRQHWEFDYLRKQ